MCLFWVGACSDVRSKLNSWLDIIQQLRHNRLVVEKRRNYYRFAQTVRAFILARIRACIFMSQIICIRLYRSLPLLLCVVIRGGRVVITSVIITAVWPRAFYGQLPAARSARIVFGWHFLRYDSAALRCRFRFPEYLRSNGGRKKTLVPTQ